MFSLNTHLTFCVWSTRGVQKRALNPLELNLEIVMSHMLMLQTEVDFSRKTSALTSWTIFHLKFVGWDGFLRGRGQRETIAELVQVQ